MNDLETMPLTRLFQLYVEADQRKFAALKAQAPGWMALSLEFAHIQQVFDRRAIEENHGVFKHIAQGRQEKWARMDAFVELNDRLGWPIVPTDEEIEGGDSNPI